MYRWFPILLLSISVTCADWPMLRGGAARTGYLSADVPRSVALQWALQFEGERLGTAMEPIVANSYLYVATHAGNLYAVDARTAAAKWRFEARDAFLHSPAVNGMHVFAASVDGRLYALSAKTGELLWSFDHPHGGFSGSPLVVDGLVLIGGRSGDFFALNSADGKVIWRRTLGAPIRQSAAFDNGQVFITAEDLRVRAFSATDGKQLWVSEQVPGQTARDYYPVVLKSGGKRYVLVRTNPLLNMGQRIGRDRTLLSRNAGIDDSSWKTIDAWIKSGRRGDPELWAKEQAAIIEHLRASPDAQSFFMFAADSGKIDSVAPIMWVAGCQAAGVQPALTGDGRLLVFHRTAYGNWNHGVAPLVGLGLFDPASNRITPLFHQQGSQPQWNAFWGTADESQNFQVCNNTVLIVHQGTLSGFDLKKNELFTIYGERDRFGGFRNPPWARNEWHGPARGGVAISGGLIYWQTGSRILCLAAKEQGSAEVRQQPITIKATSVPAKVQSPGRTVPAGVLRQRLAAAMNEILSTTWTPMFVDPGLAGRDFSFDESAELLEALGWAYPHVSSELQQRIRSRVREVVASHPPFKREGNLSLVNGTPREWVPVPREYRARLGNDKQPHPFGNVALFVAAARRCNEAQLASEQWRAIKASFEEFSKSGWRLDEAKGDLYANRYLASLLACARLAKQAGDSPTQKLAGDRATETAEALVAWWKRTADRETVRSYNNSSELDPFIGKGDGLSFAVAPHRHKIALFQDLTPEVAAIVRTNAPDAVSKVWEVFDALYRTWPLQGEERQVHFGENFVDPPDLAFGAFKALAWLKEAPAQQLARRVDTPFCRADLYYAAKLALALEAGEQ